MNSKWCIIYLASPKENRVNCPEFSAIKKFDLLKGSLEIAKRVFPSIDILIFHEDFTETEWDALPPVTQYIQVDFSGMQELYDQAPEHHFPRGYMQMCRFFSGGVQGHEALQSYSHYLRLDDDSYFLEPYPTELHVHQWLLKDYTFRTLFHERINQQSLYEFTLAFCAGYKDFDRYFLEIKDKYLKSMGFLRGDDTYSGIAPYNNFHVSSLNLWRHPMIKAYTDAIDDGKFIMTKGWLDANIHAMIIFILMPYCNLNTYFDGSFGYRHNKHLSLPNSHRMQWVSSLTFTP